MAVSHIFSKCEKIGIDLGHDTPEIKSIVDLLEDIEDRMWGHDDCEPHLPDYLWIVMAKLEERLAELLKERDRKNGI